MPESADRDAIVAGAPRGWKIATVVLGVVAVVSLGVAVYALAHQESAVADYVSLHRRELRGPRGLQGHAGVQGAQGVQGPQGATGPAGSAGPAVTSAAALTHQVCTTTPAVGAPSDPFTYRPAVTTCHDEAGP